MPLSPPSFTPTFVQPILTPQEFFLPGIFGPGVSGPGPAQIPPPITSTISGTSSVIANLTATGTLASTIVGSSSVTANLVGEGLLTSAIVGSSSLSATLQRSYALNAAIEGLASVVGFLTIPPSKTYFPPNNPMGRQTPYIIKDFGVSIQRPAYVSTNGNSLQLFYQTSFVPDVNAGSVLPPSWSTPGTPDGFNYQGRVQAPGQLLVAPGNGSLSGKIYKIIAQGMIFVPSSAVNPTFSLQMFQNYFAFRQAPIADSLFSGAPIPLVSGTINGFTLISTLAGNGVGSGVLSSASRLWLGGIEYYGNGFSNRLQGVEPIVQLSLGMQFGGTVGAGDNFQAFLSKFIMFNNIF